MSVYQLSLIASAQAQEIRNVFHYRTATPGVLEGSALDLATAFNATKTPAIEARLHLQYEKNAIDVFDLFFPANIATLSVSGNGLQAGDSMGTRVAATLRTNRATREIRRGQKRFGPLAEAQQSGGTLTAAEITAWLNLGSTLAASVLGAVTYFPIIVKRIFVALPTPHYRLPANISEYVAFDITTWDINERITTQNTRRQPFL